MTLLGLVPEGYLVQYASTLDGGGVVCYWGVEGAPIVLLSWSEALAAFETCKSIVAPGCSVWITPVARFWVDN